MRTQDSQASSPGHELATSRGFALVVTVSILVLLAVVAVGLLSLSTVTVRQGTRDVARLEARANARLALIQALGELQKHAGDDRRITANGDLIPSSTEPHAVGVWDSWSPRFTSNPALGAPNYEEEKTSRFRRWLVSHSNPESVEDPAWVTQGFGGNSIVLFSEKQDGFTLHGGTLQIEGNGSPGEFAWAVSQEATKAKLTVTGESDGLVHSNDIFHAQPRPNLALSEHYSAPIGNDWNRRAARILDQRQLQLDEDIWTGPDSTKGGAHFTTQSLGLLTNVVDGGLKADLSLGFEMADADFDAVQWNANGLTLLNPFNPAAEKNFTTPNIYTVQRPLYKHLGSNQSGLHSNTQLLANFDTAKAQFDYPLYCAPTFHTLRSHYRTHHHIFDTPDGPAIFERPMDHVAGGPSRRLNRGFFPTPALYMDGEKTQTALRPIMDRTIFIVSATVSPRGELAYMYTPVITMWNPYSIALEIEGAVSYLWLDIPFMVKWDIFTGGTRVGGGQIHTSDIGWQFDPRNPNREGPAHGRSVDPYFYGAVTATGDPLSKDSPNPTIRFQPGEVRLFVPSSSKRVLFEDSNSIRERTVFMKPFESPGDLDNLEGGIYIPRVRLNPKSSVSMEFYANRGSNYPFFVSLEDATRAKGTDPDHDNDRGHPIADIVSRYFAQSGEGTSQRFSTPRLSFRTLQREPYPFVVLESYHRVASEGSSTGSQSSDLVFTSNPRQPWMTDVISNRTTNFNSAAGTTGPQYQTRIKGLSGVFSDFLGGISNRNTFYGATNDASQGRTHLSFFEVPTTPMLSLGAFQHCDLSATTFSPANQFGNSWASAYVSRTSASANGRGGAPTMIDHAYLTNEALWDGFFFSGAAPDLVPGSVNATKDKTFWDKPVAREVKSIQTVLTEFLDDPVAHPLRNPRMQFHSGTADRDHLLDDLLEPQGSVIIAAHLLLDGAFNVNSTSVEAWRAILASLRGAEYKMADGTVNSAGSEVTPQSRFQHPVGEANDLWHGFRTLSDDEIGLLAEKLVEEVRARGPFLSLSEFVNRRMSNDALGLKGALQAAIDHAELNSDATQEKLDTKNYSSRSRGNIVPNDTAVGIPGYLTQADILQSMAPILTVRSDTFTIRGYGASKDRTGKILAEAWVEAVVQRLPEFVDSTEKAYQNIDDLNGINNTFGRKFKIVSLRYLSPEETKI